MKIPKIISKNNRKYMLVKANNKDTYLYKNMLTGIKETFTKFQLGLVKEHKELLEYGNTSRR